MDLKQLKYDRLYMDISLRVSEMSIDSKHKVGALIVRDGILSEGWNGAPSGFPNETRNESGETHLWVIHAEQNAIAKCARKGISTEDATIYVTLGPCRHCARLICRLVLKELYIKRHFPTKKACIYLRKQVE